MTGYTDRTADQREIHCGKRCHTEMQNNKIDHAEQKPYHRQQRQYKDLTFEVHREGQRQHNDQYIKYK